MNAVVLNRVLMAAIMILIIATGVGFYFATQVLSNAALATNHKKSDAKMSEDNLLQLKRIETQLLAKKESATKARQLVASLEDFSYQDRIIVDLSTYAARAGDDVRVTNFNFTDPTKPAIGPKNPSAIKGVRTLDATVTLNSPIRYTSFLKFLRAIEQNLTKMQVTGVNITPDSKDPNFITGPSVNLLVYVREK